MFELIFITSSKEKLEHAKHLCKDYAVVISKQKNYGIGYLEPRIYNREELIQSSVEDAVKRFGKTVSNPQNKFFLIEDTSVKINALSTPEKEFPGVDVKYWMKNTDFPTLDFLLVDRDRSVQVRSDVILVLPKALREKFGLYKVFTSFTNGTIAEKELKVETQPLYPWLSSKTFNKWFVPDGSKKPLSLLPIQEADKYDFRAGAFKEMLEFLRTNEKIKTKEEYSNEGSQLKLFEPYFFILCGPTCSGKSTLAAYLTDKYNYYHIEASDYMHLSYYEKHGLGSSVKIADFAEQILKQNPAIVSDQILKDIGKLKFTPIIVTGFRSPDEIKSLRSKYIGGLYVETVFVDAEQQIRFERCLIRDRADGQKTLDQFKEKDAQQFKMGLEIIKEDLKESTINNNVTLEEYYKKFEEVYKKQFDAVAQVGKIKVSQRADLQTAIISSLAKTENQHTYYTTTEIAKLINRNPDYANKPKHKDNVSRYFNQNFHPYFDIKMENGTASYRLSQTGTAYSKWLVKNKRDN